MWESPFVVVVSKLPSLTFQPCRLESELRGWFNLEPETPRFKLDLESPKRRPDSTSRPTSKPKRPRKEVTKEIFWDQILDLTNTTADFQSRKGFMEHLNLNVSVLGSSAVEPPGSGDQEAKSGTAKPQIRLQDACAGDHLVIILIFIIIVFVIISR